MSTLLPAIAILRELCYYIDILALVQEMAQLNGHPLHQQGRFVAFRRECRLQLVPDTKEREVLFGLLRHDGEVADTLPAAIRIRRRLYIMKFLRMEPTRRNKYVRQLYSIENQLASVPSIMIDVVTEASRIIEFLEPEEREALKDAAQAILDRADLPLPEL